VQVDYKTITVWNDITEEFSDYAIQQMIESLLFIANSTKPDILAAVSLIAR